MRDATASSVLTWPVIAHARVSGLKVGGMLEQAGLRPAELLDGRARIPLHGLQTLWSLISQQLGDPNLGLSILTAFNAAKASSWPEPFSLFEHLFRTSATVREGILRLTQYARLLRDGLSGQLDDGPEVGLLSIELTPNEPWPLVQMHVGMTVMLARRVLPAVVGPAIHEVWFRRAAPADAEVFETFFGVPVRFGETVDGLVCDGASLNMPLPEADAALCRTLEWRAESMLAELPDPGRTADRVREALRRALPDGDVRAQAISKRLALSPRTLHRRLQAEGESYQGVLDQVRCELAKRDLACGRYSAREVGQRVGFTSVSAFYRAFKTWTGLTPAEFQHGS